VALAALKITVGQALGGGAYNTSVQGGLAPDNATVLTDIADALAVAAGDHDSTPEIETIEASATALAGAIDANVTVVFDAAVVTTKNQLRAALRAAIQAIESGYGGLT
jgi:hypothetical protein